MIGNKDFYYICIFFLLFFYYNVIYNITFLFDRHLHHPIDELYYIIYFNIFLYKINLITGISFIASLAKNPPQVP